MGIYTASKVKHAHKWLAFRAAGAPIISTWIDEAGVGQTNNFVDLWDRCILEASTASALVVYIEPGEQLKGGLVEVGAALASGVPVFLVGHVEDSWRYHRLVRFYDSLQIAMEEAASLAGA